MFQTYANSGRYNSAAFSSLASSDSTVAVANDVFSYNGNWSLEAAQTTGLGDPGWSGLLMGIYIRLLVGDSLH